MMPPSFFWGFKIKLFQFFNYICLLNIWASTSNTKIYQIFYICAWKHAWTFLLYISFVCQNCPRTWFLNVSVCEQLGHFPHITLPGNSEHTPCLGLSYKIVSQCIWAATNSLLLLLSVFCVACLICLYLWRENSHWMIDTIIE